LGLRSPWRPTVPAADSCCTVRMDYSTLGPDSRTCNRPPVIRMTAFDAQPPNLPPASSIFEDFAISCPLVRCSCQAAVCQMCSGFDSAEEFWFSSFSILQPICWGRDLRVASSHWSIICCVTKGCRRL
jgi:hypothetical protein